MVRHIGVADVHKEERDGTTCEDCEAHLESKRMALRANYEEHWAGLSFASVPGGASGPRMGGLTPTQSERKFNNDLYAYADSKKAGLQPDSSTKAGVEKAERRAESFSRVESDAAKGKYEISGSLKKVLDSGMGK